MEKPTTFKSVKTVLTFIKNFIFDMQNQFLKRETLLCCVNVERPLFGNFKKNKINFYLVFFLLLSITIGYAQVGTKFSARLDDGKGNKFLKVQGDVTLIGNTILTPKGQSLPYNGNANNNDLDAVYLNVDNTNGNFSSSSANLLINNGCKRIVFAGLYWSAMYPNASSTDTNCFNCGPAAADDWNQVKFKVPGGSYQTLTASKTNPKEVIFKGSNANDFNNSVYVCFKDVTSILQGLADADGTYTVANLRATTGKRRGGSAGGWTLAVIYESPTLSSKYISVFDGAQMTNVDPGANQLLTVDIPISGFQTLPSPFPVNARIGVAALDGDYDKVGDGLEFREDRTPVPPFTSISNTLNPIDNFFNATITNNNAQVTNRNPASRNNLGFDIDQLDIPNPANAVINNNATKGTFRLFTNTSGADGYAAFLTTFAVEIIEPKITLTKEVFDYSKNPPVNMGGKDVTLGNELTYVIGFQNQGNDDATSFTITDILPINTKFNYPGDIDTSSLPTGVTHSYNATTKTITFTIPNNLVKKNGTRYTVRFKVKVVESCNELSDACSNIIKNTALSSYSGTYNKGTFGDKSLDSYTTCNIGVPQSTNFLVDVDKCTYDKSEILCGASIQIKAANGYTAYSWSTSPTGTPVVGTSQTLTVVKEGVYYVSNTALAPCLSIKEKFTVSLAGGLMENPVLPYAKTPYRGNITICPDNGKQLPNLFLCGASDFRDIKTGISGTGTTIVWEKLDESSCNAVVNTLCANEGTSCKWNQVGTGPDYRADTKGQFRLTITYQNNCFNQFYFNVYKNELDPQETHNDIICTTNGKITINNVPSNDYEFSLNSAGPYQSSNVFPITNPGVYTVYIRQKGVTTNPCIFQVSNITIRKRDFQVKTVLTQPRCFDDRGTITAQVEDVRGQYYYELFKNGVSQEKYGPTDEASHDFNNLTAGGYSYTVKTDDGCSYTNYYVAINQSAGEIVATPSIRKALTACQTGEILVTTSQDRNYSNSFAYYVNGSTTFQTSNVITVTTGGTYTIRIVGTNNCEKTVQIVVPDNPKPTYQITHTDSKCYDSSAQISVVPINIPAGYTMEYSINNGTSYQTNPVFSNLFPGEYNVLVRYRFGTGTYCVDTAQKVTITGPTSTVSASAGVAALAGCTDTDGDGIKEGGKLRFNNVQGGVAPYQYSYDGGITWQASPEKDVKPGEYTLVVKDANDCPYYIPYKIKLDEKPADPIVSNVSTAYNCNGTANSTVTITAGTSTGASVYTYEYYIDGTANTPITNNVFTNVKAGSHVVTVKYKAVVVPTYSNLLREDFGRGPDARVDGIHPNYCWERQDYIADCPNSFMPILLNDGEYVVTQALIPEHGPNFNWFLPKDNTAVINKTGETDGRFLAVNVGGVVPVGGILYRKTINDVIPNQDIEVSLYMLNLLKISNNLPSPRLTIQLQKNGVVIPGASKDTQSIPRDEKWHNTTDLGNGQVLTLNPGNNTSLDFVILSYSQVISGNDLAVDDIWVRQIPETCGGEKTIPLVIESGKGFTVGTATVNNVSCNGGKGSIIIPVSNFSSGYQYSVNGGNWNNSTSATIELTDLTAGDYKVIVRNDATALCSSTLDLKITAPTAITLSASVVTQPTCITGASIKAAASGGTPNYKYELRRSDGTIVTAFQDLDTFYDVPTGNYLVFVKDAGNCSSPASNAISVTTPSKPTASLASSSDICYDTANKATLVVTVSGGKTPYNYSLDGQASQLSNTFSNVGPGTHSIVVTDANGCAADAISGIVIAPELLADAQVTKTLDCTTSPKAKITVTATQGTAPYTYEVSSNGGTSYTAMATNVYDADAGSYVFRVTDAKGCKVVTLPAVVNAIVNPTASATPKNPTCNNGTDGYFTVIPAGGGGAPYTYSFNGSTTFVSDATLSNLNAFVGAVNTRSYTYQVKDNKGCVSPVYTVVLNNPTKVVASASFTPNTTCSTTTVITSAGAGGAGGYTYSFNGSTTYNATNTLSVTNTNSAQTITYSVKDVNGCTDTNTIVVPAFNPPTAINFSTPAAITCNATTTSITLTTTGGISPYTYTITAGPVTGTNTTGTFNNLTAGTYSFRVTDARGCSITASTVIDAAAAITVSGSKTDELCFNAKNGTATFTVGGASSIGNFTYTLTPNSGTASQSGNVVSVTGLAAGTYTLVVKDNSTGCTSNTASVTIGAATNIDFTVNASKITCNNKIATLTITGITGGTPGYSYAYAASPSTVPTTAYGTSLTVDTAVLTTSIDVYVKDNNNCAVKKTIAILTEDAPIINKPAAQCYTGTPINVTITGTFAGVATYSKDGTNYQASATFSLTPGTYTLYLKDGFGCIASTSYVVASQLTIGTAIVPDVSCTPNTTISLSSTGGTGAISYQVSLNGSGFVTASNPYIATVAGTYKFQATDSANPICTAVSADIPVTLKSTVLTINTSKVDVKCNGGATGSILVTPTSGKAPYSYSITRSGTPATNYTVNNPSGLIEGTYNIVVTDALGCTSASTQVIISEPTLLVATAHADSFKCNAANTKQSTTVIIDLPTTGTAPYTYSFNGGSYDTANTLSVTDNGLDQIIRYSVKDANGCTTAIQQLTINKLNPPKIASVSATPIYCNPAASTTSTAVITVTAGTGVGTPVYEIVSGPTINTTGASTGSFSGLAAGNYVFKVTDASGCYDTFPKNIPPVVNITASATKLNDVYCNSGSTGNIRYNVGGFTSTYSYQVNAETPVTGQTATVFTLANRPQGTYTVVFTDETTNCTVSTSITINQPANPLTLGLVSNVNANCNKVTSTVTVLASGGTAGYQYAILDADDITGTPVYGPSAVFNINSNSGADLNWVIYTKDANNCTAILPVTIATDLTPSVSAVVNNQCTATGSAFQIVATGTSGVAPYTYTINTGVAPSPANTFTVAPGTYIITVKDANNCTNTATVTVNDAMIANAVLTKGLTCPAVTPTDASITITVTGGRQPLGYRVKVGAGTYSGLPIAFAGTSFVYPTGTAGTYQFEITDANGCPKETNTVIVSDPVTVTASFTSTNPTCNGDSDGTIRLTALTGEGPYKYSIDNGATFVDSFVFGGLPAGTYTYVVRDIKGCEATNTVTLANPAPIAAYYHENGITCDVTLPGSIDFGITSGGTAPYTYYLYDNAMTQIATYTETSAVATPIHNFPGLFFGNYYITVVDANGCKYESPRLRIEPPPYLALDGFVTGATCADGISVTVNVTGGNPNYIYSIYGIGTTSGPTPATSYTFTHLDQNTTYVFEVVDVGGCPSYLEFTTPTISPIVINPITFTNVTCYNAANGTVSFTVPNYDATTTSLYYEIRDNVTNLPITPAKNGTITGLTGTPFSASLTGLRPGNYTLYVRELDGTLCSTVESFRIMQPASALNSVITDVVPANCNSGALVTIKTTGGTGPYTYAWALAPATPTVFGSSNVLELPYDASSTNNFNIIVKDANGCEFPLGQVITLDPSPVIALQVVDKCVAEGTYAIHVTATTAGTGAYSISVDSPNNYAAIAGLPYDVTGLASGSHTIYIKDANSCIDSETIIIDAPIKVLSPTITTLPTCIDVNGGSVTLTQSGGSGAYTYSILPNPPSAVIAGDVISGLPAGSYVVTITDNNSSCTSTAPFELILPTPVDFDAVVANASCFGSSTGSITVNLLPGNDNPVYTYSISPVPAGMVQTDNVFTNLPQGTYDITVTSGKGCPLTKPYTVNQPTAALGAGLVVTPFRCNTTNTPLEAVVTVSGTGGTAPYKYNFDGGTVYYGDNTTLVKDNGAAQTIHYYVQDANGCTFDDTVVVNPYQKLTDITFTLTTAPVCPTNVADVTLNVSGGYTPYAKYEIISPIYVDNLNAALFTGLAPDTYLFKVTDANGCSIERPYKVEPVVPIDITLTSSTNVSCNTANGINNNGVATFTVSDFSATGNYAIAVTSTPAGLAFNTPTQTADVITVTGLVEGTYTVTVTDNTTNCSQSENVIIKMPAPIVFTATASKVFCSEDVSNITVANVTGGTAGYSYAVVRTGQPAPTTFADASLPLTVDTNLVDLSWDVYVQDVNGCISAPITVPVTYNAAPDLILPAQQCYVGADLTVDLDAISTTYNGVKSFTVNGLPTGSTATFTAEGTYRIVLTDDNGCEDFVDYIIQKQLIASATLTKDLFCVAPVNATIDVVIADGIAPYTYQMYYNGTPSGASTPVAGNNFTASVAAAGNYYFVITDSNTPACSVTTNTEIVNIPTTPAGTEKHIDVTCTGFNNGSLTITPSNGVEPYTFAITGPVVNTTGDVSGTYTDLIAGSYSVIVTDAKGCTSAPIPVVIDEPVLLTASHNIPANTTCRTATVITVTAAGGTQTGVGTGYYYNFNNLGYDTTDNFTVNDNGLPQTVTYTVKDANGCETAPVTITINPLNKPTDLTFSPTAVTCLVPSSDVTVTAANGVGALTFAITEFNGAATALYAPITVADNTLSATFTGLPFGDYMFRVTDSNGCSYDELLTVKDVTRILVNGQLIADMSCNTTNDGKVTFAVSDFAGTYTYTITKDAAPFVASTTTSDASIPLTNLAFGVYEISVTDDITGCTSTYSVEVKQPSVVTVTLVDNVNANCNIGAIVTVAGSGGNPGGYTYSFVPAPNAAGAFEAFDSKELDPAIASWYVYAQDSNGCVSAPLPVNITTDPLPTGFTASATTQCADASGNYEIVVDDSAAIGMGPFEYSIGGAFQPGKTFTVNVPKTYDLTVKDRFECTYTFTAAVTILQPLDLQYTVVALPSCADGDGSISATATGGSGNYSYTIGAVTITTTPADFTDLTAGSHTVVVTDLTTNCTDEITFELGAATPVTGFDAIATPVTCNGGNNGTIVASLDPTSVGVNDNPVYMFSLNGGTPQDSPVFTGLSEGTYTVSVISGRGCPASKIVIVTEPALILVPNPLVVQYGCTTENVSNFATITVSGVTGGSGTYANYEFIKNGVQVYYGPNNVYTEMDYTGGDYAVNVYDNNQCVGSAIGTFRIEPFISLDAIDVNVTNAITCNNNEDIAVSVTTTGGTPASLDYAITDESGNAVSGNPVNQTGIFTGLPIGNYFISATNPVTGCVIKTVHYINNPNSFEIVAQTITGEICYGTSNGSVELTFVDRQPNPDEAGSFNYVITGPVPSSGTAPTAGPFTISNLTAGEYTVEATLVGSPYCTVSTVFNIQQPAADLVLTTTKSDITCIDGNNDGVIYASAEGGWDARYEYQLVNTDTNAVVVDYSTQSEFTGLTAGNYVVNVKDGKGCIDSSTQQLVVPTPINVVIASDVAMVLCNTDASATITVTNVTGGDGSNYLYTLNVITPTEVISSGPTSSNSFTNLGAGRYSVTVTDGFNCTATSNEVEITEPTPVKASLIVADAATCTTQATLTLSAEGGTGPYTYSSDANFATVLGSFTTSTSFDVPVGFYQYYVKDANGCLSTVSDGRSIDPIAPLEIKLDLSNSLVKCTGDNTASIDAKAEGGLGNYTYTLLDSAMAVIKPAQDNGIFEGLIAGDYRVRVNSEDCVETSDIISIKQPDNPFTAIATPFAVTCFGENNGRIEVVAQGGTGAYQYSISPRNDQYFDSGIFTNLAAGFYTILANDANGCPFMETIEVTQPLRPLVVAEAPGLTMPEECVGDVNGSFTIDITGGTAPYTVSLDNIKGTYVPVTGAQHSFDNLAGGIHIAYVKDTNGCQSEVEVNVPMPVDLNPQREVVYGCQTNTVTVTVNDGVDLTQVDYSLNNIAGPYQLENVFKDVAPGENYVIYARYTNGCIQQTDSFNIKSFDELTLVRSGGQQEMNVISVTAGGGAPAYEYSFNGEPFTSSSTYKIYKSGDYEVIVRDQNGCTAKLIVPMTYIDVCLDNYFTPNGDGVYDTWGPGCTNIYNNLEFSIFDRYGRVIAKYHYGQKWDGRYNGEELPSGDYWYVLKLNDEKDAREFVGHFTLYR